MDRRAEHRDRIELISNQIVARAPKELCAMHDHNPYILQELSEVLLRAWRFFAWRRHDHRLHVLLKLYLGFGRFHLGE